MRENGRLGLPHLWLTVVVTDHPAWPTSHLAWQSSAANRNGVCFANPPHT
jgi:hypothetical protein